MPHTEVTPTSKMNTQLCVYGLISSHLPWQIHPAHWPQPGDHTPTSHSTLQVTGPFLASGSLVPAASHPRCSAANRRSVHRDKYTGTYSWGKRSGRPGRQCHLKHTHLPHELEEIEKYVSGVFLLFLFFSNNCCCQLPGQTHSPAQIPVLLWTSAV